MKFFGNSKELAEEIVVGGPTESQDDAELAAAEKQAPGTSDITEARRADSSDELNSLEKYPSADAQTGVKKVEAVTLTWSKKDLYIAYGWLVLSAKTRTRKLLLT
jgi:hypothetical protein